MRGNGMRVLVVDDDSSIRLMLTHIVEDAGADVVGEADNGHDAIEASRRLKPDVVLLDISMPLMGGFPAARWIQNNMPKLVIIFVRQHRERSYREEAMDCGAKGYVIKSAAVNELPKAIEAVETGQIYCSSLVS
jgi:two-component system nitrate/nitrite response regulator NarL